MPIGHDVHMVHFDVVRGDAGSPPAFSVCLEGLTAFVSGSEPRKHWQRVEVVEVDLGRRCRAYPDRPRIPADRFEARWRSIVRSSVRDWVNISACGVDHDALVVAVEWVGAPGGEPADVRGEVCSVNFSGSAGCYRWGWV